MARLRDSAERAHLIRGHKRELARVKSDFHAKIRELQIDHADALKKAAKQLDAKRKAELEELTQKLNQQHESNLEEVEEEHQKRLSQLQKDYGRSQKEADDSLEDALDRIARVTQDHGREKGRRHALERTAEDLQRKMQAQMKELQAKHGSELDKRKRQWESEKETLLGNLQREFNVAFDNRRRGFSDRTNKSNWGAPSVHIEASNTPRSMPSQVHAHGLRPPIASSSNYHPTKHHQYQPPVAGPSPLSMNSAAFFPESKSHDNNPSHLKVIAPAVDGTATNGDTGGAAIVVPTPVTHASTTIDQLFTDLGGGGVNVSASPSIISKSYSDIDSVLRDTEELIQSIM
jgi:hypothetical protein